jgi:hypothetical protein
MRKSLFLLSVGFVSLAVLFIYIQKSISYGGFIKIRFIDNGGHPVVGVSVDHHILGYQGISDSFGQWQGDIRQADTAYAHLQMAKTIGDRVIKDMRSIKLPLLSEDYEQNISKTFFFDRQIRNLVAKRYKKLMYFTSSSDVIEGVKLIKIQKIIEKINKIAKEGDIVIDSESNFQISIDYCSQQEDRNSKCLVKAIYSYPQKFEEKIKLSLDSSTHTLIALSKKIYQKALLYSK